MDHDERHHIHVGRARALTWSLVANLVLFVAEIAGGIVFSSLALLADAAHMGSDVAALAIALVAGRLARRPHSGSHTFGLQRAEVLGASLNAVTLIALSFWIAVEAVGRFGEPSDVQGGGLLAVALAGLAVNVGSAIALKRRAGRSLNMRGAYIHMVMDALGSIGAVVAGFAVIVWNATWVDPAASIAIAVLVVVSAWRLLSDTVHVLLEGAPTGLDVDQVQRALAEDPAVDEVHHLHVWNLASDVVALSVHVVLRDEMTLHEAQSHGDRLKGMLEERFGIDHSTLELECHACEPASGPRPV